MTLFTPLNRARGRNIAVIGLVVVLCAAVFGCSSSGKDSTPMAPETGPGDGMTPEPDPDGQMPDGGMTPEPDPDGQMPDGGMTPEPDPDGQMPEVSLPTDPQAIAAAADKIMDATSLDLGKTDDDGESLTGWLAHTQTRNIGAKYASMSQSYRDGSLGLAVVWYDEDGNLAFNAGGGPAHRPLQSNPDIWPWWSIFTPLSDGAGTTTSHGSIDNHGLGAAWQGIEAMRTYEGGGTLTMRFFTDLEQSDNPGDPNSSHPALDATYPNVLLDDPPIPAIPAGWDGIWVSPVAGLRGSLDGVAGTFSCASGDNGYCGLERGRHDLAPGYHSDVGGDPVIFTPDDGSGEKTLPHPQPTAVPTVNYLTLGNWLFAPEDVTDLDAYDFGVFAGGDDPFVVGNLQGLAGTANYSGEAAGMYAETTDEAMISPFNAKVALTADFGTADDFGAIVGRVYDFDIDGDKASPLTELNLGTVSWRGGGTVNIFQSWEEGWPVPGGWIEGSTSAEGGWQGRWSGKFFGNGSTAADLPTAFAGTFGATDGDHSFAGSFGARKQ